MVSEQYKQHSRIKSLKEVFFFGGGGTEIK